MIYLITPTGGRPDGIRLLAGYLSAQTHQGPMTWLLCDDCDPATPVPAMRDGIKVQVIRPSWRWKLGQKANTQAAAMSALLAKVPDDAIVIVCEDDDCYLPMHVQSMVEALRDAELVGQRVSYYYNIQTLRCMDLSGAWHASLGASALRSSALRMLRAICARAPACIDLALWRDFTGKKRLLDGCTAVGIKGVPGRGGIGIGHRDAFGKPDPHGNALRKWIGDYAAEYRWLRR